MNGIGAWMVRLGLARTRLLLLVLGRWRPLLMRASALLVGTGIMLSVAPAIARASGLYIAVGDSVGAGGLATPGNSYFDLYCAYLESQGTVDRCVNRSVGGLTSQTALDTGVIQTVLNDISQNPDTRLITVILGGNDALSSTCQPVTKSGCNFAANMRTILNKLETALGQDPGPHWIQWVEYYNPDHANTYGAPGQEQFSKDILLGSDGVISDCSTQNTSLIGLNDVIACIAQEKGVTPVDLYAPFQNNCNYDCFGDRVHPNDKGNELIFEAFRDNLGSPVPSTPPPDRAWPPASAGSVGGGGSTLPPGSSGGCGSITPCMNLSGATSITTQGATVLVSPGITVSCSAGATPCSADESAQAQVPASMARAKTKRLTIGQAHFTIPGNGSEELTFKLSSRGAQLLRKLKVLKLTVTVIAKRSGLNLIWLPVTKRVTIKSPPRTHGH